MKIVKVVSKKQKVDERVCEYSYRLIATTYKSIEIFGIEIERSDYLDGELINIERDNIKKISNDVVKVSELFDIISENIVSPIHLIDILGEYADKYILEIEEREVVCA